MRKLGFRDVFSFLRILNTSNIAEQVAKTAVRAANDKENKDDLQKQVGIEVLTNVFLNLSNKKAEAELYSMLADIVQDEYPEITGEEISTMELPAILKIFKDMAKLNDLKNFFNSVLSFIPKA